METKELKAFIAVAEELNFRKAADRLSITQPPLTRMINKLEYDLGVKLFVRSTRHVELTAPGLHLLRKGRSILDELTKTESELRSLQKLKTGKLKISLANGAFHSNVPRLISSFKEQFPKIVLELLECPLNSLNQNLKTGKIDLAFGVNELRDAHIRRVPVQTHELGLIVSTENELSRRRSVRLSDLEGETLIFHGKHEHLGFQSEFLDYLKSKNIHPKVYYKKHRESCPHLAMFGRGVLLTSKELVNKISGITYVPLEGYPQKLKIYANCSHDNPSLPLKAFVNFLQENTATPPSEMDYHFV